MGIMGIKKIKLPDGTIGSLVAEDYTSAPIVSSRFTEIEKMLDETVKTPQLKSYVKKNDLQKQLNAMRWKMGGKR